MEGHGRGRRNIETLQRERRDMTERKKNDGTLKRKKK